MIYKGKKWRKTRTVIDLPVEKDSSLSNYIRFGRICKKEDFGAIMTDYVYSGIGQPVYAMEISCKGHSLTNMMYGRYERHAGKLYSRAYCMVDGQVYTARWCHNKQSLIL